MYHAVPIFTLKYEWYTIFKSANNSYFKKLIKYTMLLMQCKSIQSIQKILNKQTNKQSTAV